MSTQRLYWLSYDLGIRGNYNELYNWLDAQDASECGESVATFRSSLTPDEIKNELEHVVGKDARIYLIWRTEQGATKGRFIFGRRKRKPPWFGYAEVEEDIEDATG
jgi:hypothetical protein